MRQFESRAKSPVPCLRCSNAASAAATSSRHALSLSLPSLLSSGLVMDDDTEYEDDDQDYDGSDDRPEVSLQPLSSCLA